MHRGVHAAHEFAGRNMGIIILQGRYARCRASYNSSHTQCSKRLSLQGAACSQQLAGMKRPWTKWTCSACLGGPVMLPKHHNSTCKAR